MTSEQKTFEGWVILELMGHRKLGGYLREETLAGGAFLRIDVPADEGEGDKATQFYSPSAVYCITPTTEAMARAIARRTFEAPVSRWELPTALPVAMQPDDDWPDDDEDQRDHGAR